MIIQLVYEYFTNEHPRNCISKSTTLLFKSVSSHCNYLATRLPFVKSHFAKFWPIIPNSLFRPTRYPAQLSPDNHHIVYALIFNQLIIDGGECIHMKNECNCAISKRHLFHHSRIHEFCSYSRVDSDRESVSTERNKKKLTGNKGAHSFPVFCVDPQHALRQRRPTFATFSARTARGIRWITDGGGKSRGGRGDCIYTHACQCEIINGNWSARTCTGLFGGQRGNELYCGCTLTNFPVAFWGKILDLRDRISSAFWTQMLVGLASSWKINGLVGSLLSQNTFDLFAAVQFDNDRFCRRFYISSIYTIYPYNDNETITEISFDVSFIYATKTINSKCSV